MVASLSFVHLSMPSQVGYDGKVTAAAFNVACECWTLLAVDRVGLRFKTYVSLPCGCTYESVANLVG